MTDYVNLLQRVNSAAKAGDLDGAINMLRKTKKKELIGEQNVIVKTLAQFLNVRAVQRIQKFTEGINPEVEKYQETVIPKMINDFMSGKDPLSKTPRVVYVILIVFSAIIILSGFTFGWRFIGVTLFWLYTIVIWLFLLIRLIGWFVKWMENSFIRYSLPMMPNGSGASGYDSRPTCKLCKKKAENMFTLNKYGLIALCHVHSEKLKEINTSMPALKSKDLRTIRSAESDLKEALKTDPVSDVIKKNLNEIKEICRTFNID